MSATAGAAPAPSFVPDGPQVSAQGDGRLTGGSFEGSLGDGWDYCCTPSIPARISDGGAPDGATYMRFDSSVVYGADGRLVCPNVPVGFFLGDEIADSPLYLYFDVVNLARDEPLGTLHIDSLGFGMPGLVCAASESLATIPLDQLHADSSWQTRCVTLTPKQPLSVFGPTLTGERFDIGFDAFRFGPPCHAL